MCVDISRLYVYVHCFVVPGCNVARRYVDVGYCDMFSVCNVYLDLLKLGFLNGVMSACVSCMIFLKIFESISVDQR